MTNLRDALSVEWGHDQPTTTPYLRRLAADLASLIGLGVAMALSYGLTAVASGGLAGQILGYLGLGDTATASRKSSSSKEATSRLTPRRTRMC